jgi:predicted small integral membrane protein
MEKSNWVSYFKKLVWVIGLIILIIISFKYENQIQQTANEQFNFLPVIWTKLFISLLFGLYISLVLVKNWSISINSSLLWCVAVPCLVVTFQYW